MDTFSDIIDAFGGASDFSRALGIKYETARKMRQRDVISTAHWPRLVAAARERGIEGISAEALAEIAIRRAQEAA